MNVEKFAQAVREFIAANHLRVEAEEEDVAGFCRSWGEEVLEALVWIEFRRNGLRVPSWVLSSQSPQGGTIRDQLIREGIIKPSRPRPKLERGEDKGLRYGGSEHDGN